MPDDVIIFGGHGKVALHLSRILSDRGYQVSAVFRNPDHTDEVAGTGARPVVGDIETLSTDRLTTLITGIDAVVFAAGAGGGDPARTYGVDRDAAIRVIEAGLAAGTRRFIMVSYFGAGPDHGVPEDDAFFPYAEAKAAADAHLRASNLDWTIVGPGRLTLTLRPGASMSGPPRPAVRCRVPTSQRSSPPCSPTTAPSGQPSNSTTGAPRSRTPWGDRAGIAQVRASTWTGTASSQGCRETASDTRIWPVSNSPVAASTRR